MVVSSIAVPGLVEKRRRGFLSASVCDGLQHAIGAADRRLGDSKVPDYGLQRGHVLSIAAERDNVSGRNWQFRKLCLTLRSE